MPKITHNDDTTCNDAVLHLLKQKLQDIRKIEKHALADISHVCVERKVLERITEETENQIVLLETYIQEPGEREKNGE